MLRLVNGISIVRHFESAQYLNSNIFGNVDVNKFALAYFSTVTISKTFLGFCSGVGPRSARMQRLRNAAVHYYHKVT